MDRYPEHLGLMATLVLILTILDGAFTVVLVDSHCEEANPLMAWFLDRGVASFLLAKYALTATGLFFLVIFHAYPMFGSRVRVGHVVPVLVGLYLALLAYQTYLYVAMAPRDDLVAIATALTRRLLAIDSVPSLG